MRRAAIERVAAGLALMLALSLAGTAHAGGANDLAAADALFARKEYAQALQLYTRLANAGNPEAQLHLGEMYWYGEAGTIDLVKADAWLRKAAAKGNRTAVAALEVMKQRELRRAEMDYWISQYDGADLKSGQYRCPAPRIPPISKMNDEITRVAASVEAWQECYNGFVRNLNEASPLVKRIPADISKLLNKEELERATLHLAAVQQRLAAEAGVSAKLVLADLGVWRAATDAWVTEHNAMVKDASPGRR